MEHKYKHILFDADGTLFDFAMAEESALRRTCAAFGLPFGSELYNCYHAVNDRLWKKHELGQIGKVDLIADRFVLTFEKLSISGIDCKEFNAVFVGFLGEGCFLIDNALDVCRRLSRTHTLSIITNGTCAVQRKRFSLSPLTAFFDDRIFISEELGVQKPMKSYFDAVLSALPASPAECLVVGDSLSSDILGAANAGIDSCWFNPSHAQNYTGVRFRYEIDCLCDIFSVV